MANSFWRITKGIVLNGETTNASDNIEGSLFVNSSDSRIRTYIQGALREVTTNDQVQTITNKILTGNTMTSVVSGSGTFVFNTSGTITAPNATDTLVGKATTDTLTNKTLTGNTAVNLISGSGTMILNTSGTVTLPNATDTLVGKATTDTLTNKTLTGNTAVNLISGSGTMILNTTGTITLPNATDTLVGKATTDTLTNKSISGATNTLTAIPAGTALTGQVPVANGGTNLASGTSGGILGFTATGTIASSAALTASQLVIGGGAGATPTTLAAGTQFQSLVMGASAPAYSAVPLNQSAAVSGALPIGNGGTGQTTKAAAFDALSPMTTSGDMIYGGASGTGTRLPGGSANQVLKYVNGAPSWATFSNNGINYIAGNPDAEVDTTGWANYADAAGTSPVDGTGGSPATAIARSTSSPLRGTGSFTWAKSANNRQGEGTSYDFTIDSADQGRVLGVSFDYTISSGTFADNDMAVYIYDVTNATLIQPVPYNILNTTVKLNWTGTFQTAINSTSYRLILHTASTSATAYTLKFDNVFVGPQVASGVIPKAPTIQRFTSVASGTYTTPDGVQYIHARLIGPGGGGAGGGSASAGNGGSPSTDTTFGTLTAAKGGPGLGGNANGGDGGSGTVGAGWTKIHTQTGNSGTASQGVTSAIQVGGQVGAPGPLGGTARGPNFNNGAGDAANNSGAGGNGGGANSATSGYNGATGGAGGYAEAFIAPTPGQTFSYNVPAGGTGGSAGTSGVAGGAGGSGYIEITEYYYGTNTILSAETDTRIVAARLNGSSTNATTGTPSISWTAATIDTHGGFNGTTGYTFPVAGRYRISMTARSNAQGWSGGQLIEMYYNYNATGNIIMNRVIARGGTENLMLTGTDIITVTAGKTLVFNMYSDVTTGFDTIYATFERISGPQQIASSESVNAVYTTGAGQSIASGSTTIVVDFGTKEIDSHNAVTTGASWKFTAPMSGVYEICAMIAYNGASFTKNTNLRLVVQKNGSDNCRLDHTAIQATDTFEPVPHGSRLIKLVAGDTLAVGTFHGEGTSRSLDGNAQLNYICIKRVGN